MEPIIVSVSDGAVQDIANIPQGLTVEVHDYDTTDLPAGLDEVVEECLKRDSEGNTYFLGVWQSDLEVPKELDRVVSTMGEELASLRLSVMQWLSKLVEGEYDDGNHPLVGQVIEEMRETLNSGVEP